MRAGIALDNWKLPIFRKRLTEAGFRYEDGGALTGDTTILKVETDDIRGLGEVIRKCQAECSRVGKP